MGGEPGGQQAVCQSEELMRSLSVEDEVMPTEDPCTHSEQSSGQADTRVCCPDSSLVREAGLGVGLKETRLRECARGRQAKSRRPEGFRACLGS